MLAANKFHSQLAKYFAEKDLYLDSEDKKKPYTRKLVELPYQQVKAEMLDEAVATLCDLLFIEAKCRNGMTFVLAEDYRLAYNALPEAQAEIAEKKKREERINKWTREIIEYSRKWNERHEKKRKGEPITEPEPVLPEVVPSVRIWTDEEIEEDTRRIIESPTRLDKLKAFLRFVNIESSTLNVYCNVKGFVMQHAYNSAPTGPIMESGKELKDRNNLSLILREWNDKDKYIPNQAELQRLEVIEEGRSLCITPDGKKIVFGDGSKIFFWDLESGRRVILLQEHDDRIYSLSITPNGKLGISVSLDCSLKVWNLENGSCIRKLNEGKKEISKVCITADGRLALIGSCESVFSKKTKSVIELWNLETGERLRRKVVQNSCIDDLFITQDGKRGMSISSNHYPSPSIIRIWDLESGKCIRRIVCLGDHVNSLSPTPDLKLAVSGSIKQNFYPAAFRIWDLENRKCLYTFENSIHSVYCVSISHDGKLAVSGGDDNKIHLWDLKNKKLIRSFEGHLASLIYLTLTPDCNRAISIGEDKTIRVWDLEKGECLKKPEKHRLSVESIQLNLRDKLGVSGSIDRTLRVWDLKSRECLRTMEGLFTCFCISPCTKQIISASEVTRQALCELSVWDLESGNCLRKLDGYCDYHINKITITPDGKLAIAKNPDHSFTVWDIESGKSLSKLDTSYHTLFTLSDCKRAVSYIHTLLLIFDIESGELLQFFDINNEPIDTLSITPSEKNVVFNCSDKTIRVWDIEKQECLHVMKVPSIKNVDNKIRCIRITPDGLKAVTLSNDLKMLVWDLEHGEFLGSLEGHSAFINDVKISSDGLYAISVSDDMTLRVWDLTCYKSYAVKLPDKISSLNLSNYRSGIQCYAGTKNGEVLFLKLVNFPSRTLYITATTKNCAQCPSCGYEFEPTIQIKETIDFHSYKKGRKNYDDSRLFSNCPNCKSKLKFNPFFSANEDYIEILKRGLEYSKKTQEKNAHIKALIFHLQKENRMSEVKEYEEALKKIVS